MLAITVQYRHQNGRLLTADFHVCNEAIPYKRFMSGKNTTIYTRIQSGCDRILFDLLFVLYL